MNIVVVSQYLNLYSGGAERYIHEVCHRLESQHGFSIRYISGDTCRESGISEPHFRFFTSRFNLKWVAQLKKVFRQNRPDAVYLHYTVPGITDAAFYAAKQLKIPCAVMYHSDISGVGWLKKMLGAAFFYLSAKRVIEQSDVCFVSSDIYIKNSPFLKKCRRNYVLAPPGVDLPVQYIQEQKQQDRKKRAGICKHSFILFVGKPDLREKGFHVLKQAWLRLRKKGVQIMLVAVGDHPAETAKDNLKAGLVFTGRIKSRTRLFDLYASAVVTVMPSLTPESFGMVLAEALAAGSPVIGSDIGGIPELIQVGKNGYLVPPGDIDSLVKALEDSISHNGMLRNHIKNSKKALISSYNWDTTAETVAELLK